MGEAEIVARVERDRAEARIQALLDALRAIASHADERKPADCIGSDDARALYYSRQDAWHGGHDAGVETGRWLAGSEAQAALDDWERTA